MHHGTPHLLRGAQPRKRPCLDVPIDAVAVGAPLDGDQGAAEAVQRVGLRLQRQAGGAVHEGAVAFDGGVEGRGEGAVDDADDGDLVDCEAERDADVGVAVHEVDGAVYWVADEGWEGGEVHAGFVGFFAEEAVERVSLVLGKCAWCVGGWDRGHGRWELTYL